MGTVTEMTSKYTCVVVAILTLTLVWANEEDVLKQLHNIASEVQELKAKLGFEDRKIQQLEGENQELKNEIEGLRDTGPFITTPQNTYGINGGNVTLDCAVQTGSLYWIRPDGRTVANSFDGVYPQFNDGYALVVNGNRYTLVVLDANTADAGQYSCDNPLNSAMAYAEIIMLDSDIPTCTQTPADWSDLEAGDVINLECEIGYQGLWAPIQDWADSDGNIITPNNFTTDSIVVYDYTHAVASDDDGNQWLVNTRFPAPPEGAIPDDVVDMAPYQYYSRTIPTYSSLHESSIIVVFVPVSEVVIDPVQSEYHPGDTITCSADGNPDPDVRWIDVFNNTVEEGPTLLITPAMEGPQTLTCLATNTVRDETYTASMSITFNVTIPAPEPASDVSFFVYMSRGISITPGSILIYDVVVTNVGDGYNVDLGSFIAPVHGLYYFNLYMQTYRDTNSPLGLYLNSDMQCAAQGLTDYDQGTCSALIELQVGDVINVKAFGSEVTLHGDNPTNGLVGYLYQAL